MRHKWIKRRFRQKLYDGGSHNSHQLIRVVGDTYECTYCGLRKGSSRDYGFFPMLVYFDAEKILSTHRLPFSCQNEWIGGELPLRKFNETFLEEEEFKV